MHVKKLYDDVVIAICKPQCQNGGRCVGVGICQCRCPYYGPRCKRKGILLLLSCVLLVSNGKDLLIELLVVAFL